MNKPKVSHEKSPGLLLRFFSNPVVGVVSSICSVTGVFLAIYFFVASTQKRELTYFVHPIKTVVARADQSSRLSISVDRVEVSSDVTAAQIAFWNVGNLPIRPQNILRPFKIHLPPGTAIVDALIRKKSREVIELDLISEAMNQGTIEVSWNILEKGDGGIIQLIYLGTPDTSITASGIVEGQGGIDQQTSYGKVRSPAEQYEFQFREMRHLALVMLGFAGIFVILGSVLAYLRKKRGAKSYRFVWFIIAQSFVAIVFAAVLWIISIPPGPPFGF